MEWKPADKSEQKKKQQNINALYDNPHASYVSVPFVGYIRMTLEIA